MLESSEDNEPVLAFQLMDSSGSQGCSSWIQGCPWCSSQNLNLFNDKTVCCHFFEFLEIILDCEEILLFSQNLVMGIRVRLLAEKAPILRGSLSSFPLTGDPVGLILQFEDSVYRVQASGLKWHKTEDVLYHCWGGTQGIVTGLYINRIECSAMELSESSHPRHLGFPLVFHPGLLFRWPSAGMESAHPRAAGLHLTLLAVDSILSSPLTFLFFHFRNFHRNLEKIRCQFLLETRKT